MVELIVFLHQIIHIVGDKRRTVYATGFGNHSREIGQMLNERNLFFRGFDLSGVHLAIIDTGFDSLAHDRADAGVGVLNERPRVPVEVDRIFGIESHVLAGIDFQDKVFQCA